MTRKQLEAWSTICVLLGVAWAFGFGALGMTGMFGDPNKPANPLWLVSWLGGVALWIMLSKRLAVRAKEQVAEEPKSPRHPEMGVLVRLFTSETLGLFATAALSLFLSVFIFVWA